MLLSFTSPQAVLTSEQLTEPVLRALLTVKQIIPFKLMELGDEEGLPLRVKEFVAKVRRAGSENDDNTPVPTRDFREGTTGLDPANATTRGSYVLDMAMPVQKLKQPSSAAPPVHKVMEGISASPQHHVGPCHGLGFAAQIRIPLQ